MSDTHESSPRTTKYGDDNDNNKVKESVELSQLPTTKGWRKPGATLYQGCWLPSSLVTSVITFQTKFKALDHDIILASNPKSGTTWLKSLAFSIVHRHTYTPTDTPLLTANPHALVPFLEFALFRDPPLADIASIPSPRVLSTHVPYMLLPDEITRSAGEHSHPPRIVYVCRNPLDTIVSFWHFMSRSELKHAGWTMEECVDTFCADQSMFGPFWRHVLGYWKASLENLDKVLFLKYEDMLEDPVSLAKRLSVFMGFPFSAEEENNGVDRQIVDICSFGQLKELDVNKYGKSQTGQGKWMENKALFRNRKVGDWVNHLNPAMVEKVEKVIQENLGDSGLEFKYKI